MKALILAAGYGTRLKPYTETVPKACMPFFGLPQILYNCELLKQAGVTDIIINTHHLANEVVATINKYKSLSGLNFSFSHEPELLNSGGGIKKTKDFFGDCENFFVINADTMMLPKNTYLLQNMLQEHKSNNALATMGTVEMSESLPEAKDTDTSFAHRALWTNNSLVVDIHKNKNHYNTKPEHFSGCYVFSKEVFTLFPDEEEFHIFDGLIFEQIKNNKVYSYLFEDTYWFETGNKGDFIKAHISILDLLLSKSENISLLKATWKKYQPDALEEKSYDWVHEKLQSVFS